MERTFAVENINNRNGEIEDEFDSCTDDKVYVYEAVISGGYIKQEPCDTEDEPGNIHNYVDIKDDDACVYETVINGGYVKQEPCDTTDQPKNDNNYATIKDEIIEDSTVVKQETGCTTNIKGNYLTCCEGCGEEYDLYCLKCPMLIRIFDGNNPDLSGNDFMRTLPKNFVDTSETPFGVGIVAVRVIPKGVVFGPFREIDLTKDDALSQWASRNQELVCTKDPKWLNWMQYIRRVDQNSHPNLTPFQYEDELYYQSECHISVGDELVVCCDSDREESGTLDSCFKPRICKSLDDVYACTLCCIGYKSICHLAGHNSRCPQKSNQNDFCKEIIQCASCQIYLDEKEYLDYHADQCIGRNGKSAFKARRRTSFDRHRNEAKPIKYESCDVEFGEVPLLVRHREEVQRLADKTDLEEGHIAAHTDDKPYACSLCSYKSRTKSRLKRHTVIHKDDKPFACVHCPYKGKTTSHLNQHIATHNGDKPFGCALCPYKTTLSSSLKRHIATHTDDKPFTCSLCSYKARRNVHLKQHIITHYDDKPFACSLCSHETKTKTSLNQHMSVHSDDKPFACLLCSYKTTASKRLKDHMVIHSDDKPFACSICSHVTKTKSNLKLHMSIHNDHKPFACSLCSFKTKTKGLLKLHLAIHNDDKPFACSICSFKGKTNQILKRHIATHTDDKPFACSFCSFKTRRNSGLKTHLATHKDDKPFACSICPYKTKTNLQLKRHIVIHNGDKSFACTLCLFKARTNYTLKVHMAAHSAVSV